MLACNETGGVLVPLALSQTGYYYYIYYKGLDQQASRINRLSTLFAPPGSYLKQRPKHLQRACHGGSYSIPCLSWFG